MENIYCDPAPDEDSDEDSHYKVPRPLSESEVGVARRESGGVVYRRTSSGVSQQSQRSSSNSVSPLPVEKDLGEAIYANNAEIQEQATVPPIKKPQVPPKPPTKPKPSNKIESIECADELYESMEAGSIDAAVVSTLNPKIEAIECADELYESMDAGGVINNNVAVVSTPKNKPVSNHEPTTERDPPGPLLPPTLADYEDLDELDAPPPAKHQLMPALEDYVEMSGTDPMEDLRRSEEANKPHPPKKEPGTHIIMSYNHVQNFVLW